MEREPITPVPLTFRKNGFQYDQVFRAGNIAIYMQRDLQGKSTYYEVWVIRISPATTIGEYVFARKERAPGNEDWGKYGFSFYTLQGAQKKAEQLASQADIPKRTWKSKT